MQFPDGFLHIYHRRGHQGTQAYQLDLVLYHGLYDFLRRYVLSKVDHIVAVIFQQYLHNVFADVVDIAFDRRQHNLILFDTRCGRFHTVQFCPHYFESGFSCIRAHQQLRKEEFPCFKILADAIQCGDQRFVDDRKRLFRQQFLFCGGVCALFQAADDRLS